METVGRSADGKRVVVALDWHEIQTLLDSAVQDSGRRRRNAKKQHDPDGVAAADFALNTANNLESAWFDTKRQAAELEQVGQQVQRPQITITPVQRPKITITPVQRPKITFHRVSLDEDGEVVVDEEGSTQQVGPHDPNYRYEAA